MGAEEHPITRQRPSAKVVRVYPAITRPPKRVSPEEARLIAEEAKRTGIAPGRYLLVDDTIRLAQTVLALYEERDALKVALQKVMDKHSQAPLYKKDWELCDCEACQQARKLLKEAHDA